MRKLKLFYYCKCKLYQFSILHISYQADDIDSTLLKVWLQMNISMNWFGVIWSILSSGEILNKLKFKGFLASSVSTYDFSPLYTKLFYTLIKEKTKRIN